MNFKRLSIIQICCQQSFLKADKQVVFQILNIWLFLQMSEFSDEKSFKTRWKWINFILFLDHSRKVAAAAVTIFLHRVAKMCCIISYLATLHLKYDNFETGLKLAKKPLETAKTTFKKPIFGQKSFLVEIGGPLVKVW